MEKRVKLLDVFERADKQKALSFLGNTFPDQKRALRIYAKLFDMMKTSKKEKSEWVFAAENNEDDDNNKWLSCSMYENMEHFQSKKTIPYSLGGRVKFIANLNVAKETLDSFSDNQIITIAMYDATWWGAYDGNKRITTRTRKQWLAKMKASKL